MFQEQREENTVTHVCHLKKTISEMVSEYKKKETKVGRKAISRPTEVWSKACAQKMPASWHTLSCKLWKRQGSKESLAFILIHPSLLGLFPFPASRHWELTCSQHQAEHLGSGSVPRVRHKKPGDAAVLQARGVCMWPSSPPLGHCLMFLTACPRSSPFLNIYFPPIVSSAPQSCI